MYKYKYKHKNINTNIQRENGILVVKKNETLSFATTRMQLPSTTLSETGQRKTNTIWSHSYVEFRKQNQQAKKGEKREKPRTRLFAVEDSLMVSRGEVGGRLAPVWGQLAPGERD